MGEAEKSPRVSVFAGPEDVAHAAADKVVAITRRAIRDKGRFSIALAGGSTPKRVYELLASDEYRDKIDWAKVHIFFGDERCVPPDHRESNYRMANEALLSRVGVPSENVHRMRGECDVVESAREYEGELRAFFRDCEWPQFDLVLLGMGDDGHTASLFPRTLALKEQASWVVANWVDKFNAHRLTLTAPAINNAAYIIFLVTGVAKADRLVDVIKGKREPEGLPAQLINPLHGTLAWFVDKEAAVKL